MGCMDLEILLSAYANDELSSAEHEFVDAHLVSCPDCNIILHDFQEVRRQVSALTDSPITVDVKDSVMAKISNITSPAKHWLRRSLVAIPVVALLVALAIFQPWVTTPGFQEVLAKSYLAVVALKSYRTESTATWAPGVNMPPLTQEAEYVAPDRYYFKTDDGANVQETIKIGATAYYKTTQEGAVPQIINPDSSGLTPDMGNTFRLLNTLHGLQTLKDEAVDGVECYHYRGNFEMIDPNSSNSIVVDIWISKDDNLPRKETFGEYYTLLYTNLNKPLTIEAPLTASGELQPGWHILLSGPHLTANYSDSIGSGEDTTHSSFTFDINLYNDGLEEAKDVHITLQTMATGNYNKPAIIEGVPTNTSGPVNITSWGTVNFKIQWEFDSTNLTKMDLIQLLNETTFTVTYYTADGTEITDTYPKTIITLPK